MTAAPPDVPSTINDIQVTLSPNDASHAISGLPFHRVIGTNDFTFTASGLLQFIEFSKRSGVTFITNSQYPHVEQNLQVAINGDRVTVTNICYIPSGSSCTSNVPLPTNPFVDIRDNGNTPPNANTARQPSPTYKIKCPTGESFGPDHICPSWKQTQGLTVTSSLYSPAATYSWPCTADPNGPYQTPPLDYPCPLSSQKDIYVEIDYMQGHQPSRTVLDYIKGVFSSHGVFLHFLLDEQMPLYNLISGPTGATGTNFNNIKTNYFGTSNERTSCPGYTWGTTNCDNYIKNALTAKKQIFHWILVGENQTNYPAASGLSEMVSPPGTGATNDAFITLGTFDGNVGSVDQQEATIMHELGHTLDLGHGGPGGAGGTDWNMNCKPNYMSVMNWLYQFSDYASNRVVDYSWEALPAVGSNVLNEGNLVEGNGLQASASSTYIGKNIAYGVNGPLGPSTYVVSPVANPTGVDWNADGDTSDTITQGFTINNVAILTSGGVGCTGNAGAQLKGFNDWATTGAGMAYDITASSYFTTGAGGTVDSGEIQIWIVIIMFVVVIVALVVIFVWLRRR